MTPTRPRTLLAVGIVCALAAWLAVRASYPEFPALPWTAAPALLLLAAAEAMTGRNIRNRVLHRGDGKPVAPIGAARAAALAKASSLGGAVFAGLAGGALIYALRFTNLPVARRDAISTGITLATAIILVAAALYLEHCCRTPRHDDDEDSQGR